MVKPNWALACEYVTMPLGSSSNAPVIGQHPGRERGVAWSVQQRAFGESAIVIGATRDRSVLGARLATLGLKGAGAAPAR